MPNLWTDQVDADVIRHYIFFREKGAASFGRVHICDRYWAILRVGNKQIKQRSTGGGAAKAIILNRCE